MPDTKQIRESLISMQDMPLALHEFDLLMKQTHVVICLSGMSAHTNGSPIFGCKVYGPFTEEEVEVRSAEILRIEGGAVLVRPMVDLEDTYRRLSGD